MAVSGWFKKGYPIRIIDPARERLGSLERLREIKADKPQDPRA